MKKHSTSFCLFSFLFLALMLKINTSNAQSNWEAGVRFGDNFSADVTIPISAEPRLHGAVYFDHFGIGTYFDWMYALNGGPEGLKFYPGVGPEFFFENRFDLNIAGDFGAEYSFKFPLTIALDWRPAFAVTNDFKFGTSNWGLSARFRFCEGVTFKKAK